MKTKWLVEYKDGTKEIVEIEQTRPTFDHVKAALSDYAAEHGKPGVKDFEMKEED